MDSQKAFQFSESIKKATCSVKHSLAENTLMVDLGELGWTFKDLIEHLKIYRPKPGRFFWWSPVPGLD